jgi:hypothetical protein
VVSQYIASLGLVKSAKDKAVRILQLAFYDEDSRRAVVSSVMGLPERILGQEEFLKELVFSAYCIPSARIRTRPSVARAGNGGGGSAAANTVNL